MRVRGGSGAAASPAGPPAGLRPMHPTAARELPADQGAWAFEPKWDGYRALGHVVGGGLALRSRNGVDMAGWFPELGGLAGALGEHAAVLDGEVVAFDAEGRPSFEALQQRMASRVGRRRGAAVTYLVFDLLWLDGRLLSGGQAAPEHLPARPADPELAQDQALPARDVPGRRLRPRPRPGPLAARRPARPGPAGPAALRRPGRPRPGPSGGSGSYWGRWSLAGARSTSPRRPCSGAAGPGPARTSRPRCSSAPSWPWRSPSWAGSRDGCATLPGAA